MSLANKIPIYRHHHKSSEKSKKAAQKEVLLTILFSSLPIWFFPLVFAAFVSNIEIAKLLGSAVSGGELYIYASALMGPMIFWIFADNLDLDLDSLDDSRKSFFDRFTVKFPDMLFFAIALFLLLSVSAIAYSFVKFGDGNGASRIETNDANLLIVGIIIYLFTILLFYFALALRHEIRNPLGAWRQQTNDFVEAFKQFDKSGG